MLLSQLALCSIMALVQVVPAARFADGIFNSEEKERMDRAAKVEDRIKIYEAASKRLNRTMELAVADGDFSKAPDILKLWISLLSGSLEDIEENLKTRKKSKPLIRYEIQVRKAITALQEFRTRAPVEQQDLFDTKLAQAEKIRKRFVEIIFKQ
ncbi:MAG: hypothetical protein JXA73_23260 [Acidobacteria bacterium]|nr:hypothetical protein [Acidobacteriota bacterium]